MVRGQLFKRFVVTRVGRFLTENSCRRELLDTNIHPSVTRNAYEVKEFTQLKKLRLHEPSGAESSNTVTIGLRGRSHYHHIEKTPRLEHLQLHGDYSTHGRFFVSGISPGLKEIILHEMYLPRLYLHRGQPPPTSITNLTISNVIFFWKDFQKFPDFFPLLERFEITSDESELLGWQRPDHFVVLKNLREVVVHGNEYCFPMMYSTAPRLRSLSLLCEKDCRIRDILEYSDILSFIERSKAPLETLKYKRMRVEYYSDVFVSILKCQVFGSCMLSTRQFRITR